MNLTLFTMSPDFLERIVLGAFHNSAERYDPPKCHPHTREAILTRIMLWVDDPANEAQIMWMFGPAGAGKSAIAQSIAEMCFQQGELIAASFFFSRNASGHDNETHFISTLFHQLSLAIPEIRDAVNKALEDDRLLLCRSLHVQAQSLITNPLNGLLVPSSENVFQISRPRLIIVDGLDECGQAKNQNYVLDILSTVTRELTYPLLFFISSRPEQAIRDSFSKESMCSITTRLPLDDTAYQPNADIERFLRSKLQDILVNHPAGADIPSGWPSRNDISRLVEKSSGQFIYASTVVKFVESTCHQPQER